MTPLRIFISSVQKEFAGERKALADYLRNDPLIHRCVAASLPEREFVVSGNFVTTIRRPDYATQLAKVQGGVQGGVQAGVQVKLSGTDIAMLQACIHREITSKELRKITGYTARTKSFEQRLKKLLLNELLEMTDPDRPRSPNQKYRLTDKGRAAVARLRTGGAES